MARNMIVENLPAVFFKNGTYLDLERGQIIKANILIQNGIIRAVCPDEIEDFAGRSIEINEQLIVPGLIDMHVHFREPGDEPKETLETGVAAAMAGGFTTVCTMPNTRPAIDNSEALQAIFAKTKESLVRVLPIAAITRGRQGKVLTNLPELVKAGAIAFSDDGSAVLNTHLLNQALQYSADLNVPIIEHCEDPYLAGAGVIHAGEVARELGVPGMPGLAEEVIVARDLILAEESGGHLHVAHLSTARSVELVRQAKRRGINVTCEVTPHHFTLTEMAVKQEGANAKMNPPLRPESDLEAIKAGLRDGTIDVIASDHAPHTAAEKNTGLMKAPFGIVGLETMLALTITHLVESNILTLTDALQKITINPAKILGLNIPRIKEGEPANFTIFNPNQVWHVDKTKFYSKSRNTPFNGWWVKGKVFGVYNNQKYWQAH